MAIIYVWKKKNKNILCKYIVNRNVTDCHFRNYNKRWRRIVMVFLLPDRGTENDQKFAIHSFALVYVFFFRFFFSVFISRYYPLVVMLDRIARIYTSYTPGFCIINTFTTTFNFSLWSHLGSRFSARTLVDIHIRTPRVHVHTVADPSNFGRKVYRRASRRRRRLQVARGLTFVQTR